MKRPAKPIDLALLPSMTLSELHALWRETLGGEPPKGRARDLMRLELAWAAQAAQYGDLDASTKRLLRAHARKLGRSREIVDTRIAPVGATLVREWRGETHSVNVVREGYLWQGRAYGSLSAIAKEITGIHRSGPRFFGLMARDA